MKWLIFVWLLIFEIITGTGCSTGRANLNVKQYEPVKGGIVTFQIWNRSEKKSENSRLLAFEKAKEFCEGEIRIVSEEAISSRSDALYVTTPRVAVPFGSTHKFIKLGFACVPKEEHL